MIKYGLVQDVGPACRGSVRRALVEEPVPVDLQLDEGTDGDLRGGHGDLTAPG
ncbi:hypothetical protein [Actinomadura macra]|uniref:hypothetical protein n=1 Tax=Actinomadura macra TaxID=46164 RepID=UPI0012F965DB|nr:hypothetical protein [Actinomadura macra]